MTVGLQFLALLKHLGWVLWLCNMIKSVILLALTDPSLSPGQLRLLYLRLFGSRERCIILFTMDGKNSVC
jgi:hypothetical protein